MGQEKGPRSGRGLRKGKVTVLQVSLTSFQEAGWVRVHIQGQLHVEEEGSGQGVWPWQGGRGRQLALCSGITESKVPHFCM